MFSESIAVVAAYRGVCLNYSLRKLLGIAYFLQQNCQVKSEGLFLASFLPRVGPGSVSKWVSV